MHGISDAGVSVSEAMNCSLFSHLIALILSVKRNEISSGGCNAFACPCLATRVSCSSCLDIAVRIEGSTDFLSPSISTASLPSRFVAPFTGLSLKTTSRALYGSKLPPARPFSRGPSQ